MHFTFQIHPVYTDTIVNNPSARQRQTSSLAGRAKLFLTRQSALRSREGRNPSLPGPHPQQAAAVVRRNLLSESSLPFGTESSVIWPLKIGIGRFIFKIVFTTKPASQKCLCSGRFGCIPGSVPAKWEGHMRSWWIWEGTPQMNPGVSVWWEGRTWKRHWSSPE